MSEKIDITNLAMGALVERTADEFQKTLENIADRNTDWKKKRKLSIEIVIYARSEKRDDVAVDIQVKNSIAPYMPIATQLYVDTDNSGNIVAQEYTKGTIPGQAPLVDKETGEILNDKKIINMNKGGK
jgi:hypothetical protein